ncbi:MAG: hypothetical protein NTV43_00660 [Methylococcales bacterium]|nr:hypothetical protein [Methylococcales bacterium]
MVSKQSVAKLKKIVKKYKDEINLPKLGKWKKMSDNDIWTAIVIQVVVVGGSAPHVKVKELLSSQENWYGLLLNLSPKKRTTEIHNILRSAGVRYVSENKGDCRKTDALVKNLALLESLEGPKIYLQRISKISDEAERVSAIIKDMSYIKNKGARDFLIGVGLIENAIAFDVRVKKVLELCGIELPNNLANNKSAYKELETELIDKVCRPLEVSGSVLDRILYQKNNEIVESLSSE